MKITVHFPSQYRLDAKVAKNPVRQLARREFTGDLDVRETTIKKKRAWIATRKDGTEVLIVDRSVPKDTFAGDILRVSGVNLIDPSVALRPDVVKKWIKPLPASATPASLEAASSEVLKSWRGKFQYRRENRVEDEPGLRSPQFGALHAILAHWTVAPETPATVVMPTGTGKTETMLALHVNQLLARPLVIVPTSPLRDQIGTKFLTLGVLRACKVIPDDMTMPVVGFLEHGLATEEDADAFFRSCNVVIATMQAVNTCSEAVRRKISELCSHLVIDEAHHVSAPSWNNFRRRFHGKSILQFTATPFRNDGKHVAGKIIYNYPLRKAQEEEYFTKINFRPVFAYVDPDRAIADAAIAQLRNDIQAGYDHIVMARVDTIDRAKTVYSIYETAASQYAPLIIHSKETDLNRREAIRKLRARESRIIVCVDMLGEGFDLPELKIAALHDTHKSLAITLQFTGRFTRVKGEAVGEATMIANRANVDVELHLRGLYAEDADWNQIIRDLSHEATGRQEASSEFQQSFKVLPLEIPIQTLEPKMSTVVFRTACETWDPSGIRQLFPDTMMYTKEVAVSQEHNVAWFVTEEHTTIPWGDVRDLENVAYNLYLIHWDHDRQLLFINSSNNDSQHDDLAAAVTGDTAILIRGEDVYRAMHGIVRMVPTNLGLLDQVSRTRRFMMYVGADVTEGLEPAQTQTKTKTNLFGFGYEAGERASIGCSLKGKIWSYLVADDLSLWVTWCHHIGEKLIDATIKTDEVFKGFIKPKYVRERPPLVPLAIEWPLAFLAEQEHKITVDSGGGGAMFFDVSLDIVDHKRHGPIRFTVTTEHGVATYEAVFSDRGTRYVAVGKEAEITIGRRVKPLSEWFHQSAPKIYFEQDTFIEHDLLLHVERDILPFDLDRIETWDWTGIDLKKESQGLAKATDSVQRKVIAQLLASGDAWDIIYDDDDSREIADVVALRMADDRLIVHLYHCKFSSEPEPGWRIVDVYPVCGQAQKSVYWREKSGMERFIPHLVSREQTRLQGGKATRFERGNFATLEEIGKRREVLRPEFKVFVVQPGLSKAKAARDVLELLSATSLYLRETFNIDFGVITSA